MRVKKALLITGLVCAALALGVVFWPRAGWEPKVSTGGTEATQPAQADRRVAAGPKETVSSAPAKTVRSVKTPHNIPASSPLEGEDAMWQRPPDARPDRKVFTDAEVLAKGGVLPAIATPALARSGAPIAHPSAPIDASPVAAPVRAADRRHSINAQDWDNKANMLVNALRADEITELDHARVMDFLQGKDLQGWPESLRNWIGDELMIVLCSDQPEAAFTYLRTIQENPSAPAAMRDYSVQHIAQLVANGRIGEAGADYIWQTLEQNDPVTLSTALVALQRLSETQPKLVAASRITQAAEKLLTSQDLRTQITAKSILKKTK